MKSRMLSVEQRIREAFEKGRKRREGRRIDNVFRKAVEQRPDDRGDGVEASRGGFTQEVLELGEDLLDRVQIG